MNALQRRLEVFRDYPKYPIFIAILKRKGKESISVKGPECFVYFSLKCIVVRICLVGSYKQVSISLIITRLELCMI